MGEDGSRGRVEVGPVLSLDGHPPEPGGSGSLFGRRKGKQLRPGQSRLLAETLPRLAVPQASDLDPRSLFEPAPEQVILEIGFGGGEHLAARADGQPETGFIGCEPFVNGMAKLLAVIESERLANIRVWDQDATALIAQLRSASIDGVYLLYPDPWPKRRQRKRRFLSDANLDALGRVMRPGAELRFATDIDDYAGWALARVFRSQAFRWTAERAGDWRRPWPGWPGTRYEAKARREGRPPAYLTFERL